MLDNLFVVDKDKIVEEANNLKLYGYRLAAVTCEKDGENLELTYHFDLDYIVKNLRIVVSPTDKVKSISKVYLSAYLVENEFQDLYGLEFTDLTIDYKGNLYLAKDSEKAPMMK